MPTRKLVVTSPPVESLLAAGKESSFWPKDILDNPEVVAQSETRRKLSAKLDDLFRWMPKPTTEITKAVDFGEIALEIAGEVYELLADFLEADQSHKRLILYLPFEFLPDKSWLMSSDKLADSARRFTEIYLKCWRELLKEIDVRANFSDGDILEPEISPGGQSMVCKAAHLIPKLAQKGLISVESVFNILTGDGSGVLKNSVIDALPVLADMSLVSPEELKRIMDLCDLYLYKTEKKKIVRESGKEKGKILLEKLVSDLDFETKKIDMREALDFSRGIPKLRVAWERQERENALIEKYAERISEMLVSGFLSSDDTRAFLARASDKVVRLSVINGVRKSAETIAEYDSEKAGQLFLAHEKCMRNLWLKNAPGTRDALISSFSRLANLGVVDFSYTERFGIRLSRLDAQISKGEDIIGNEIRDLKPGVDFIATDPEVSRAVYPAVIFFGSRLKGYAKNSADLDVAVFIKPGVSKARRPEIRQALSRAFSHKKIDGKIVEFWLAEEKDGLRVLDFPDADVFLADSTWIHLLFAGVWLGKKDAIRELYSRLLPGFIYSEGKKFNGRDAKSVWLGEMEREVLQYRLMHKGYRRLYPEYGGIKTEHARGLDPQSSFWDSGYRRIAAKLFISRVYLPRLKERAENK